MICQGISSTVEVCLVCAKVAWYSFKTSFPYTPTVDVFCFVSTIPIFALQALVLCPQLNMQPMAPESVYVPLRKLLVLGSLGVGKSSFIRYPSGFFLRITQC